MARKKRAQSLRKQLFNKQLYARWQQQQEEGGERDEIQLKDLNAGGGETCAAASGRQAAPTLWRRITAALRRSQAEPVEYGRRIPVALGRRGFAESAGGGGYVDRRSGLPYIGNAITSSRYSVYSFLPRQLCAQFSKVVNSYFFGMAILQMVPNWSTTGQYTTIVPLSIFMGISIAREGWEDFRRHKLDREENNKLVKVLAQAHDSEFGDNKDISAEARAASFTDFETLQANHGVAVVEKQWKDVEVGEFVLLNQDDWVPADLFLLATDGDNNECYVETMALDGETNLKCKHVLPKIASQTRTASGLATFRGMTTVEDPNIDLYNFEGKIEVETDSGEQQAYSIGLDNVLFRGSIIRNTQTVVGMVVFTGEETKIRMNAIKNPRIKSPKLQTQINLIVLFMILVVAIFSFLSFGLQRFFKNREVDSDRAWYLMKVDAGLAPTIMSFIIMYNTLIPLSLYVTMEIIKDMQSRLMEWDIDMYHLETNTGCTSRTATILEELGQVSYIFSDKTGTLTDNRMIFRKFSFCGTAWEHDVARKDQETGCSQTKKDVEVISVESNSFIKNFELNSTDTRTSVEYKGLASATYTGRPSIASQIELMKLQQNSANTNKSSSPKISRLPTLDSSPEPKLKTSLDLIMHIQLNPNTVFSQRAKFFILALALCHTCLPKKRQGADSGDFDSVEYQSSSPDELALVTAARDMGYVVLNRNGDELTIKTYPDGFEADCVLEKYEVLNTIDFSSDRKRMSVLVRMHQHPEKVLLICKGADNVILERLHNSDLAQQKLNEINTSAGQRKIEEAELVLQHRKSLEQAITRDSIGGVLRQSMSLRPSRASLVLQAAKNGHSGISSSPHDQELHINSIDDFLGAVTKPEQDVENIFNMARKSTQKQQRDKYARTSTSYVQGSSDNQRVNNINSQVAETSSMAEYIGSPDLITNEEYVIERTLQDMDAFTTEGLRTLLYSFKWIGNQEYETWNSRYSAAKAALVNRREQMDTVGEIIERDLTLLGTIGIEDKLQEGVPDAIDKLRRAGIKMWMLTGDKRETAINIGYSCRLIHDYSTVIILAPNDENMASKITTITQEIEAGNVAHCVVVIDGATLTIFEGNLTLMTLFIELCTKTDSVICCRSSPSQKALMVTKIRKTDKKLVTLAIGDGANDIAMIQSADIGVDITGKEGLQASRSSDYSIAQFRYLLKLLLVHGRYNYIRTSKFVLCTFYKEFVFYLTQLIFQINTMFSGTSQYEPWCLTVFNTLFTSLPVLCIGMFEKDLKSVTLLSIPELYTTGRQSQAFNLVIFLRWMAIAALSSVIICFTNWQCWSLTAQSDNTLYPIGLINYTAVVVLVNVKCQLLEMANRNWLAFASFFISVCGWLCWCLLLPAIYKETLVYDVREGLYHQFGPDITFWATNLVLVLLPVMLDLLFKTCKVIIYPSDTEIFAELEQRDAVRKKLEFGAFNELKQGWTWQRDPPTIKRLMNKAIGNKSDTFDGVINHTRSRKNTLPGATELPPGTPSKVTIHSSATYNTEEYEQLPSGKLIKRKNLVPDNSGGSGNDGFAAKLGRKLKLKPAAEDIDEIIERRMQNLE
ncbi:AFL191Wp [Eremothecium gossypii ATCC 10895]|uniref:Phospholipid-transporting ATPase n=1 Tax=Eremothecium gossypii (strain ATCC 10895 / CBS 109.51 / FGSC 9923 / NRRL Y-1056) TaxID=284811 RepID=Q755K8_EREGS|nr:AFL191Wp [Eremothecium gossypii ATCC 10895]AAS53183.1 AFL191Wp [Eremothecium gossypii ATCC 10895]AEY97493.1 FAFL191Wp [Eremothecium gossypii FDAG1]